MNQILFVCLGNICRSPTAEGVFRQMAEKHGLHDRCDSAGTSAWHIGSAPDARSMYAAQSRGYDLSELKARQVCEKDFYTFDYILAMDDENLSNLNHIKPVDSSATLDLFLNYGSQSTHRIVPDPYHSNDDGFDLVLDLVEDAAGGLIKHIQAGG